MAIISPPFQSVSHYINLLTTRYFGYDRYPASTDAPVVSIISSFYNVSKDYFTETNLSIRNQTFQNYEWIIVEDCSTDSDAVELFKGLPSLNPKIKTMQHSHNRGVSAGRNTAISQARGRYLFFMDLDDLLDPTMIEKCVLFLETHPDFSFVSTYSVGFQAEEYWWNKGFERPSNFIEENTVTGRLLYRKSDFNKLGGYDETLRFNEDWERWLKAFTYGQKAWTIPEYLECYRRTNTGLLSTSRSRVIKEKETTELIKDRYRAYFETHEIPDSYVDRPMFDMSVLRQTLHIANPINVDNLGKRILCWFPHLQVGGADKFNLDLLIGLKHLGYDITIVTTVQSKNGWFADFYQVTPDIFHLPSFLHYGHWLAFAKYMIESRNIDIFFISNAYYAYYLLPLLRKQFPHVAFVDYTHTEDPGWRGGGYPRISAQMSNFLDKQLVTSQMLADCFIDINPITAEKLDVCYINVDEQQWQFSAEKRQQVRHRMSIADETTVILLPARVTGQKRPLFFVEIIRKLVAKGLPIAVLMLGSGDLLEPVKEKVSEYGLGSILNILPFATPEDMIGYYSACDLILLPSAYEGISLVMYEAMSMQLPVVASDVGGQKELLTSDSGFLLPLGAADNKECDEYVEVLTPLVKDVDYRRSIGRAARKRIESKFTLKMMVERMHNLFQDTVLQKQDKKVLELDSFSMAEELLIWVQEFLSVDGLWNDVQTLNREVCELREWSQFLISERDFYRTESSAWQKVARNKQAELSRTTQDINIIPSIHSSETV